jgi:hypothetical protein
MEPYACTAINGSGDHHRNGEMQTVDLVDCRSGRIVDFEIVVNKTNFHEGNLDRISNGMETAWFTSLLQRRLHDLNVRPTVIPKDSKLRHKILNSGSHAQHKVHTNRTMKVLARFEDSLASPDEKHLFGLQDLLKSFRIHILHQQIPVGQQVVTEKIIAVVIILLISIRTALPRVGTEIM